MSEREAGSGTGVQARAPNPCSMNGVVHIPTVKVAPEAGDNRFVSTGVQGGGSVVGGLGLPLEVLSPLSSLEQWVRHKIAVRARMGKRRRLRPLFLGHFCCGG